MNRYERGTRVPGVALVERIDEVLNLPVAYFYSADRTEATLLLVFHRMREEDRKRRLATALKPNQ
jgi:transcriptional regulator with XRE-family HTH domain